MDFFWNRSKEIGHYDASEEGIVVCRLIADDKVLDFWDWFCWYLFEELSEHINYA